MSWFRKVEEETGDMVKTDPSLGLLLRCISISYRYFWGRHQISWEENKELSELRDKLVEESGFSVRAAEGAVVRYLDEKEIIRKKKLEEEISIAKLELDKILEEER